MFTLQKLLLGIVLCCVIYTTYTFQQPTLYPAIETGGIIDDSDTTLYPQPAFRAMSDFDTTQVDATIKERFEGSISGTENPTGRSAETRHELICGFYDSFCDKLIYDSAYSAEEKYTFMLYSLYFVTSFDANVLLGNIGSLGEHIASITFFSSPDGVRGQAGERIAKINTQLIESKQELFEILVHEVGGHIVDIGLINDSINPKNKNFLAFGEARFGEQDWSLGMYELSRATDKFAHNQAHVSGYGASSPYEGFAEFTNAWMNHHAPLIKLAIQDPVIKQKYMKFRELYGTRFINLDIDTYTRMPLNTRSYDTTRWNKTLRTREPQS